MHCVEYIPAWRLFLSVFALFGAAYFILRYHDKLSWLVAVAFVILAGVLDFTGHGHNCSY